MGIAIVTLNPSVLAAGLALSLSASSSCLCQVAWNCDPSRHLQESPGPPGPKSQKSLKKGFLGGSGEKSQKMPEKV